MINRNMADCAYVVLAPTPLAARPKSALTRQQSAFGIATAGVRLRPALVGTPVGTASRT